jgi:hypothetical protein
MSKKGKAQSSAVSVSGPVVTGSMGAMTISPIPLDSVQDIINNPNPDTYKRIYFLGRIIPPALVEQYRKQAV